MKILNIPLLFLLIFSNLVVNAQILSSVSVGRDYDKADKIIKPDKIGPGRTADEKIYEFVLPPNQWVETSLLIKVNQEVLIHHFTSSEAVSVRLAGTSFPTLQKPGTIIPAYTSSNCSRDPGVKAKVRYFCVQMSQSERVKLSAKNSVRVAIAVKNR